MGGGVDETSRPGGRRRRVRRMAGSGPHASREEQRYAIQEVPPFHGTPVLHVLLFVIRLYLLLFSTGLLWWRARDTAIQKCFLCVLRIRHKTYVHVQVQAYWRSCLWRFTSRFRVTDTAVSGASRPDLCELTNPSLQVCSAAARPLWRPSGTDSQTWSTTSRLSSLRSTPTSSTGWSAHWDAFLYDRATEITAAFKLWWANLAPPALF